MYSNVMQDTQEIITNVTQQKVRIALTLGTIAIALFNTWIAYKLSPVAQNIIEIQSRVDALEKVTVPRSEISLQLDSIEKQSMTIDKRLDRLENYLYGK